VSRIVIAGCGDVGSALGVQLARAGHEVWGVRRRPERLPSPLRGVAADLCEPSSLHALPADPEVIVYAAAADERSEAAYRRAYVDGVRNVIHATARGGTVRLFVFTSSTAVYGQQDGEWVDEDSVTAPRAFNGRLLLEGERLVLAGDVPGAVVRLAGVYGPGRTRLIDDVRAGRAVCRGDGPVYANRVHRDDCASALAHVVGLSRPDPLWLAVDDEPAARCDVLRWLASRLGATPPAHVPGPAESPGKRCRNAKLRRSGWTPRYPTFREGYEAVLGARGARPADPSSPRRG
jgi:nucleoside-diphosphate-sugar epimerase